MDLGKLQALYFTVIVVMVYGWLVWSQFVDAATVTSLPAINEGLVGIILISHSGYIGLKAVPQGANPANGAGTAGAAGPPSDDGAHSPAAGPTGKG